MLERVMQLLCEKFIHGINLRRNMKREKRCPYFLKGRQIHVPADAVIREAQVFSGIIRGVKGV